MNPLVRSTFGVHLVVQALRPMLGVQQVMELVNLSLAVDQRVQRQPGNSTQVDQAEVKWRLVLE